MDTDIDRMAAEVMVCVRRIIDNLPAEYTPVSVLVKRAGLKTNTRIKMAIDMLYEYPQVEIVRVVSGHVVRAARAEESAKVTGSSSPQPSPTGACGTRPSERPGGSEGSKPSN